MIRRTAALLTVTSIPVAYYYLKPTNYFDKIKITEIEKETHNTLRIGLSTTFSSSIPFHIIIKDDSCEIGREYSPVTLGNKTFLIVKLYPQGTLSNLFKRMRVGDYLSCSKPLYTTGTRVDTNTVTTVLPAGNVGLVAGGTGITPCFQIIQEYLTKTSNNVSLFYINRTRNDILLKKELLELVDKYPTRFNLELAVDSLDLANPENDKMLLRNDERINTNKNDIRISVGYDNFNLSNAERVVVCGPAGFVNYLCRDKLPNLGFKDIVKLKS